MAGPKAPKFLPPAAIGAEIDRTASAVSTAKRAAQVWTRAHSKSAGQLCEGQLFPVIKKAENCRLWLRSGRC